MFAVLLLIYTVGRASNIELFRECQKHLNTTAGVINTLDLITASNYILVKFFEYNESLSAGFSLGSNKLYLFYCFHAFLHLMQVYGNNNLTRRSLQSAPWNV